MSRARPDAVVNIVSGIIILVVLGTGIISTLTPLQEEVTEGGWAPQMGP